MTNDAANQRANTMNAVLDLLPPELLLIHRRLENDGGSWRASLPPTDLLLHRLQARPPQQNQADHGTREDRATLHSAALSASTAPSHCPKALRPRSRRKDPYR